MKNFRIIKLKWLYDEDIYKVEEFDNLSFETIDEMWIPREESYISITNAIKAMEELQQEQYRGYWTSEYTVVSVNKYIALTLLKWWFCGISVTLLVVIIVTELFKI